MVLGSWVMTRRKVKLSSSVRSSSGLQERAAPATAGGGQRIVGGKGEIVC